jgi:NAD(P)-dependent dehydrogenase (short-subunit alcohol dehydrogenase family)
MQIKGKTALITGAGSGIGRATAIALADKGAAKIVVVDISAAGARETAQNIAARGAEAIVEIVNVADADALQGAFHRAREAGGLDIAFNNAGIAGGPPFIPDTPLAKLQQVVATNLTAVILGTQLAVQAMIPRGGGAVVNTCSGTVLLPTFYDSVYVATKAAVLKFTQSCASLKDSHNVRVNTVLPGLVRTPMVMNSTDHMLSQLRTNTALVEPEEIAAAVIGFIEDDSKAGAHRRVSRGNPDLAWTVN